TLTTRLTALCQSISAPALAKMGIIPETFISNVVVTRNFYTHAGSGARSKKKPVKSREMFLLNQRMRALLRGAMLLHLGLPENQIAEVLARDATKWQ
ncbi:MAG TPA: HEPN domain-containing protein, partial [Bryobacteraceae bacterium]|nr:HEPN domain-containing protein [Bryobacteraceae bacterium]